MIWVACILGGLLLWFIVDMFICYQRAVWTWPQKAKDHREDIYLFLVYLVIVLVCVGYIGYYIGKYAG